MSIFNAMERRRRYKEEEESYDWDGKEGGDTEMLDSMFPQLPKPNPEDEKLPLVYDMSSFRKPEASLNEILEDMRMEIARNEGLSGEPSENKGAWSGRDREPVAMPEIAPPVVEFDGPEILDNNEVMGSYSDNSFVDPVKVLESKIRGEQEGEVATGEDVQRFLKYKEMENEPVRDIADVRDELRLKQRKKLNDKLKAERGSKLDLPEIVQARKMMEHPNSIVRDKGVKMFNEFKHKQRIANQMRIDEARERKKAVADAKYADFQINEAVKSGDFSKLDPSHRGRAYRSAYDSAKTMKDKERIAKQSQDPNLLNEFKAYKNETVESEYNEKIKKTDSMIDDLNDDLYKWSAKDSKGQYSRDGAEKRIKDIHKKINDLKGQREQYASQRPSYKREQQRVAAERKAHADQVDKALANNPKANQIKDIMKKEGVPYTLQGLKDYYASVQQRQAKIEKEKKAQQEKINQEKAAERRRRERFPEVYKAVDGISDGIDYVSDGLAGAASNVSNSVSGLLDYMSGEDVNPALASNIKDILGAISATTIPGPFNFKLK